MKTLYIDMHITSSMALKFTHPHRCSNHFSRLTPVRINCISVELPNNSETLKMAKPNNSDLAKSSMLSFTIIIKLRSLQLMDTKLFHSKISDSNNLSLILVNRIIRLAKPSAVNAEPELTKLSSEGNALNADRKRLRRKVARS